MKYSIIEDTDCGDTVNESAEQLSINHKSDTPVEFEGLPDSQFVKPYKVERFWEKSFPTLFTFGRAGPQHNLLERENEINDTEYDKHVLKESSRHFSQNMMWMASRYRYRTSKDASSAAYVAILHDKTPTARDISQVSTAYDNLDSSISSYTMNIFLRSLFRAYYFCSSKVFFLAHYIYIM